MVKNTAYCKMFSNKVQQFDFFSYTPETEESLKKKKKSGLVHNKTAHDKPGSELIIHWLISLM